MEFFQNSASNPYGPVEGECIGNVILVGAGFVVTRNQPPALVEHAEVVSAALLMECSGLGGVLDDGAGAGAESAPDLADRVQPVKGQKLEANR